MATSKLVLSHNIASVFVLALVGCSGVEQHQQSQQDNTKTTTLSTQSDGEIAAHLESIRSRFKIKPTTPVQPSSIPTPPGTAPEEVQQPLSILGKSVATSFVTNTNFLKPEFDGFKKWNGLRTATVKLPVTASGAVELEDDTSKVRVSFALRGAEESAVRTVDGYALYQGGFRGSDIIHRAHPEGTEDYVVFETKPDVEALVYDVDVSRVTGLRLVSNVLEFMDEGGAPRLRIAPPYAIDSQGQRHEAKIEVSGCDYDTTPAAPWGRTVTRAGASECGVHVKWEGVVYPAMVDPAWTSTGSMAMDRNRHTATLLGSGQVLVVGGEGSSGNHAVSELYDPVSGTFSVTGAMSTNRISHTSSFLNSGKVLVAGGRDGNTYLATATIYDPSSGSFGSTGSMSTMRLGHTASNLQSGKVLIAGGDNGTTAVATAQLYDPSTGAFSTVSSMNSPRAGHGAIVLESGNILITGGASGLSSAEIYNPTLNSFTPTGSMNTQRTGHTTTLLPSGKVLVAGGSSDSSNAELFDPLLGVFSVSASIGTNRSEHTASLLDSGIVLLAGGQGSSGVLGSAMLFDHQSETCFGTGALIVRRWRHTATLLDSGTVLVVGGALSGSLKTAEIFRLLANGGTCSVAGECLSSFCVSGYCCDAACDGGSCDRCDLPQSLGTCTIAPVGNAGIGPVCASPHVCDGLTESCSFCVTDAGCKANYYCAADGSCKTQKTQAAICNPNAGVDCYESGCRVCATGQCVDGFCCDSPCDGKCDTCAANNGATANGSCTVLALGSVGSPPCAPYFCDGSSAECPVGCGSNSHCSSDLCEMGECVPTGEVGETCAVDAECDSGFCSDGYCCNAECNGQCESCILPGLVGTCTPVSGQPVGSKASCGGDGTICQPTCVPPVVTQCSAPNAMTECLPASCENGVEQPQQKCSGQGVCVSEPTKTCSPFACEPVSRKCYDNCVDSTNCAAGYFCHGIECIKASVNPNGDGCVADEQCVSGHCVGDICCDAVCDGKCQSCDGNSNSEGPGKCSNVVDGKDPKNDCSKDSSNACGEDGMCDGAGDCRAFTKSGEPCGQPACEGDSVQTKSCDGFGECLTDTESCSPYNCDTGLKTCKTTCVTTADCSEGAACSFSGLCTLGEASCSNKTTISQADGSLIDCSPFICQAGQCTATCSANSDCASTASCTNGQCVDNGGEGGSSGSGGSSGASGTGNNAAPKDDGGCGCRVVQNDSADWRVWGALALGLGMVARRRGNRRVQLR